MKIIDSMLNALALLEAKGCKSGEVHDRLADAIRYLNSKHPSVADEEITVEWGGW